jgi:hypothetical protein
VDLLESPSGFQQSWSLGSLLPQGKIRPSLPLAARSHSSADGKRFPFHRQKESAASALTQLIGCWRRLDPLPALQCLEALGHALAFSQARYSPVVTSVLSIQKSGTLTS